jgi:hypothetical protein
MRCRGRNTGNCLINCLKNLPGYLIHTKREKVSLNQKFFSEPYQFPPQRPPRARQHGRRQGGSLFFVREVAFRVIECGRIFWQCSE